MSRSRTTVKIGAPCGSDAAMLFSKTVSGVDTFQIQLNRASGVYYAGEVVKGTVKLVTSKDIKTRGVRLRLQGQANIHWHTGSGDNRNDYDGQKIFEEHRCTMFGNYFNTSLLDEVGEDAKFGFANGDGIMYIPCSANEKLELIVRVMDYDFGKRDDLLGEIVVDTNALVSSETAQSFPLQRKGNPEKGEVTLSAKIVPLGSLFESASSHQRNAHDSILMLRCHQATGLRKADWIGKNDVYVQAYRQPEGGINQSVAFPPPDKNATLPAGVLEFPFSFQLRSDAPATAELRAGDWAYIRYTLYANIDIAWWSDPSVRIAITVLNPMRPLPPPSLLYPVEHKGEPVKIASCLCFPCLSTGDVTVDVWLSRQVFAPGERMSFRATVLNNTPKPIDVAIELRQCVVLATTGRHECSCHTSREFLLVGDSVDPQDTWNYDCANREALHVPAVYPSFFGATGMISARREPLKFSYMLRVKAQAIGTCPSSCKVDVPIIISGQPPSPAAIQAAEGEDRAPIVLAQRKYDAMELESSVAVSLDADAAGSHTIGSPSGGGYLFAARNGQIDTTGDGPEDIRNFSEDHKAVNPESLVYVPHVITYAEVIDTPRRPIEAHETAQATAVVVVDGGSGGGYGGNGEGSVGDQIAATMRLSSDKRGAVLDWLAAHPESVGAITPADITTVLKNVDFSMDQSTVAGEMAKVMGRQSLRCAHVVAACEVCSFFKTEMACVMAPYVGDPNNSQTVSALVPSFDRTKVESAFVA
mmetsp:Transcript_14699/g.24493  ORF Transcript_14699/g.24493 Transcript_14699/m.24493 type:complete len:757 (-) Transcript_14699:1513-3783(-)